MKKVLAHKSHERLARVLSIQSLGSVTELALQGGLFIQTTRPKKIRKGQKLRVISGTMTSVPKRKKILGIFRETKKGITVPLFSKTPLWELS